MDGCGSIITMNFAPLNPFYECTRGCLLIRADRRWSSAKGIEALVDVMVRKEIPEHICDNGGPKFEARDLRK